ncbi:hypothetical protein M431DRAFT_332876 [Trichoderma harzianum CBS 226.95]|uniref:Uncharacterized protein n=1 Tax=Trichoderma harzianum CBS 226.95 TaxID=983964 RepID=A0A2T3ZTM7_TRIHA|nr:hypothetical protein M431DRAFT_332876 [Trichoderma harzianum CBS 226.95]PTB48161.1 hypothetical protein M431DRAFT_332876 [Trichoderma harzianum CBS 226.95]
MPASVAAVFVLPKASQAQSPSYLAPSGWWRRLKKVRHRTCCSRNQPFPRWRGGGCGRPGYEQNDGTTALYFVLARQQSKHVLEIVTTSVCSTVLVRTSPSLMACFLSPRIGNGSCYYCDAGGFHFRFVREIEPLIPHTADASNMQLIALYHTSLLYTTSLFVFIHQKARGLDMRGLLMSALSALLL